MNMNVNHTCVTPNSAALMLHLRNKAADEYFISGGHLEEARKQYRNGASPRMVLNRIMEAMGSLREKSFYDSLLLRYNPERIPFDLEDSGYEFKKTGQNQKKRDKKMEKTRDFQQSDEKKTKNSLIEELQKLLLDTFFPNDNVAQYLD